VKKQRKPMTRKEAAIIKAAVEWNENPETHEDDCGCKLCVTLASAVAAYTGDAP